MNGEQAVDTQTEGDNDFNAGFAGTSTAPAPTETPAAAVVDPAAPAPQATPEIPAPAVEPAKTVQITEDQFQRLTKAADSVEHLTRQQDKAFGKMGALEEMVTKLQAETPAGQQIEVSDADFEDLAKEFPDLAALQIKGLNKVLGKMRGTGGQPQGVDPAQFEKVVAERVSKAVGEVQSQIVDGVLGDRHPDWQQLRDEKPADYQTWLQSLPETDRNSYLNSNSPFFVAKKLDDFKEFRKKAAAPVKPTPADPAAASRKEILQASVTPRGTGGQPPAPTGDDDFNAGFKKYAPSS